MGCARGFATEASLPLDSRLSTTPSGRPVESEQLRLRATSQGVMQLCNATPVVATPTRARQKHSTTLTGTASGAPNMPDTTLCERAAGGAFPRENRDEQGPESQTRRLASRPPKTGRKGRVRADGAPTSMAPHDPRAENPSTQTPARSKHRARRICAAIAPSPRRGNVPSSADL